MILRYNEWVSEQQRENPYSTHLDEKLITFGGRAYPKFGNIVIISGGAGSGKDFQLQNLLGIEGKVFDVDHLKTLALSAPKISKEIGERMGINPKDIDLTNPEHVKMIHDITTDVMRLGKKRDDALERGLRISDDIMFSHRNRKPNLIFNVTMARLGKLWEIGLYAKNMGYDLKDIHIVWVINDIEVAKKQNLDPTRGRVVPEEILINTHSGASNTMADILEMGEDLGKKYMDGDIWLSFNKKGVNTRLEFSPSGGSWIADAEYFKIKERGKRSKSIKDISPKIREMIGDYVPSTSSDRWKKVSDRDLNVAKNILKIGKK